MKTTTSRFPSERGSLLIVAMIISAVIGIALASYLQLGRTSLGISNRALYNNAAVNLAENGLEEAMYSINQLVADETYAWPDWENNGTIFSSAAWRIFKGYTLDQNTTGYVRVYVYNYKGINAPKLVARSTIELGGGRSAPIEKWIEVTLRKTSKFANGLVAKNSIVFNGTNTAVDSWNSDPDNDKGATTAAIPYSASVRDDNGSVGSISVGVNAVLVKQADVWGFVSTGGSDPTSTVGTGGSILGDGSSYDPATWTNKNVDPARVSTEFAANFDPVTAPAKTYITTLSNIHGDTTLPRVADSALRNADGNFYYEVSDIHLVGEYLKITDKVVIKITGSTAVRITGGTGNITISSGSSLQLYTDGSIDIAGQGVANGGTTDATSNQPINFQIWGTKTSGSQSIAVKGQVVFSGTIYAPQGDVAIDGSGSVSGSVVANNITLVGNANFHYDESLANFDVGNPYRVSKWKELTTAADRATYSGVLSF